VSGHPLDPGQRLKRRIDIAADVREDPEKWREHMALLDRHEPFRDFVYQLRTSDGSLCIISVSGNPVFDVSGRFLSAIAAPAGTSRTRYAPKRRCGKRRKKPKQPIARNRNFSPI
jgi:hypothetical protein